MTKNDCMIADPFIVTVRIKRVENSPHDGTFGVLLMNDRVFCVTLELPDKDNQPNASCIPPGQYTCDVYQSRKFGKTYIVRDVPDRSGILFHAGNSITDTAGCILLASSFAKIYHNEVERRGVLNSGETFQGFMNCLEGIVVFKLTITENF